jgi:hypothetical protein
LWTGVGNGRIGIPGEMAWSKSGAIGDTRHIGLTRCTS